MQKEYSLFQLNNMIKKALSKAFPTTIMLVAEIAEMNTNRTGHCYLNLIEKSEQDDSIKAQARATIWASTYRIIESYFQSATGRKLEKGLKVLVSVEIVFHEAYGFSLNIKDIDPSFTLGDLERKKREILKRLETEGVINMNKEVQMPFHPKKIAIISSPTAAGYGDFINQLENNPNGFYFAHRLFPAIMQGDNATESIINALDKIYQYENFFDVVVLIRGGGSSTDLSCFDTYELALNITQFPLPIIAGIGHERDITIADTVAHTRVKTPTAAASFIINKVAEIESFIIDKEARFCEGVDYIVKSNTNIIKHLSEVFAPKVQTLLRQETGKLNLFQSNIRTYSRAFLKDKNNATKRLTENIDKNIRHKLLRGIDLLNTYPHRLKRGVHHSILNEKKELENYKTIITLSNPENLLRKGYSLTYINGKLVKDIKDVEIGQEVCTKINGGNITSTITTIKNNN